MRVLLGIPGVVPDVVPTVGHRLRETASVLRLESRLLRVRSRAVLRLCAEQRREVEALLRPAGRSVGHSGRGLAGRERVG